MTADPELMIERVLVAVERVPAGCVVSYGDLAELVGTSARRVGAILKDHGGAVPWWRVVNASGELPTALLPAARERWAAEGVALAESGRGCRIGAHRADLMALGEAYAKGERS
ncbi:MAG: MGMT family protein [Propionibacteriaceae bacterium]|nr:MGMT family protein [Propionibacteriaceae bacterium]